LFFSKHPQLRLRLRRIVSFCSILLAKRETLERQKWNAERESLLAKTLISLSSEALGYQHGPKNGIEAM
jgi:hypothetical protein